MKMKLKENNYVDKNGVQRNEYQISKMNEMGIGLSVNDALIIQLQFPALVKTLVARQGINAGKSFKSVKVTGQPLNLTQDTNIKVDAYNCIQLSLPERFADDIVNLQVGQIIKIYLKPFNDINGIHKTIWQFDVLNSQWQVMSTFPSQTTKPTQYGNGGVNDGGSGVPGLPPYSTPPSSFQQPSNHMPQPQPFHNQMGTPMQQPQQSPACPQPSSQPTHSVQGNVQSNQSGLDMDEEYLMSTLITNDKYGAWKNYAKHGQVQFIEAYDGVAKHEKRTPCAVHRQNVLWEEYKRKMRL